MSGEIFEGGCLCGAVRYSAEGTPHDIVHCHCTRCRRSVGAPFVTWASFRAAGFVFTGADPANHWSTPRVCRTFCKRCGTSLTNRNPSQPDEIVVNAATLDEPDRIVPEQHIWTSERLSWVALADDLPEKEYAE